MRPIEEKQRKFSRHEWMGKRIKLHFEPHWPVRIGNYIYDGFTNEGVWVSHDHNGQRHVIWYDIERIELA